MLIHRFLYFYNQNTERMPADFITTYFTEEKIESLFFIIISIITIALALIFLFLIKYSFFKGMAIPLLAFGIIELSAGAIVLTQSAKDLTRIEQIIKNEPQLIQSQELPKMEFIIKNFVIYKWIEIILIITGVVLFIMFYKSSQTFWKGFGLGLLMQASIMLSLNILAQQRLQIYILQLIPNEYIF